MGVELRYNIAPIEEWVNSEYYIGKEATSTFPFWKKHIIDYFQHPERRDLILSGSARSGKSTIADIICIRYIYEMGGFSSFPSLFGLSATTLPKIIAFSYSKGKSSSQLIDRMIRIIDQAPFFQQKAYKRYPVNSKVKFPWVEVVSGSQLEDSIGEDAFGAILDEASLRNVAKAEVLKNAQDLYTEIRMRSSSTFSLKGNWAGFSILIATAGDTTSFTDTMIQKSLGNTSDTKCVIAAQYDVAPERFSDAKFKCYIGDDDISPFIIDEVTDDIMISINAQGYSLEQYLEKNNHRVVYPPISSIKFYREDIGYALQQISGISLSLSENSLFSSSKILDNLFTDDFKYPTQLSNAKELVPFFGMYDSLEPEELIDFSLIEQHYHGEPVFGHVDLSSHFDPSGLALCFYNEDMGRIETAFASSFYLDRRIPDNQISQDKLLRLIQYLVEEGLNIQYLTTDLFGAESAISQQLRLLYGPQFIGRLSVEEAGPYIELLSLAKRGKVVCYDYSILRKELSQLIYNRLENRVDHPRNPTSTPLGKPMYTKDVSDAFCGAVWNVITHVDISFDAQALQERIKRERERNLMVGNDDFYSDILDQTDGQYETEKEVFNKSLLGLDIAPTASSGMSVRDLLGLL
jgi:hypothetical protein